jgi:hypothetical protein
MLTITAMLQLLTELTAFNSLWAESGDDLLLHTADFTAVIVISNNIGCKQFHTIKIFWRNILTIS